MINPALPQTIEPYRLADREVLMEGSVNAERLPRLLEAVLQAEPLQVSARFYRDEDGNRLVSGNASTTVAVTCERCLDSMPFELETEFLLVMVTEEAQLSSVPKHYEPWLVLPGVDVPVADLLEDTVLLALPQFPMHSPDECAVKTYYGDEPVPKDEAGPVADKPNPFSILADLKSDQNK